MSWRSGALALFLGALSRHALAGLPPAPLVEWTDPFWEGVGVFTTYTDRENSDFQSRALQAQVYYGLDRGISFAALLPVVLNDSTGFSAPRLGGGPSNRAELDVSFRFWGDAYDYVAATIGAAFPFQTDPTLKNSANGGWALPFSIFGRADYRWVAFKATFTDDPAFPNVVPSGSVNSYVDPTNIVTVSLTASFFSRSRVSPFLTLLEVFPQTTDIGFDAGPNSFLTRQASQPRSSFVGGGLDFAPFKSQIVLSLEADDDLSSPDNGLAPWRFLGKLRWVF